MHIKKSWCLIDIRQVFNNLRYILILKILILVCCSLIIHTYLIFPLILLICYTIRKKDRIIPSFYKEEPLISCLISVHNEDLIIEKKIQTILHSDYPKDKIKIFVGSDASTDHTNQILQRLSQEYSQVHFYIFDERRGKASVINDLAIQANKLNPFHSNHILLLTDANVLVTPSTLKLLVTPYSDPKVGLIDCRMMPIESSIQGIAASERTYIHLESKIKHWEGELWGCMMGAFGGCYSIRSTLFTPIPSKLLVDDFYLSMKVLEQGYYSLSNLNAEAFEQTPHSIVEEFRRKKRIATGNWQNLELFWPILYKKPFIRAFCFFSHKILRWLTPILFLISYISLGLLGYQSGYPFTLYFYIIGMSVFMVVLADYLLPLAGIKKPITRPVAYFIWMNIALFLGFINYCKGVKTATWKPTQR